MRAHILAVSAAAVLSGFIFSGCGASAPAAAVDRPVAPGFAPTRPYDPKIDVPVEKYGEDPRKYNRYWDAEKHGGTGIYEPWRDPMWSPRHEFGVL